MKTFKKNALKAIESNYGITAKELTLEFECQQKLISKWKFVAYRQKDTDKYYVIHSNRDEVIDMNIVTLNSFYLMREYLKRHIFNF